MSILRRIGNALIALSDLRNPRYWMGAAFGGRSTLSGVNVTPASAMTLSAYFAAIRSISEDVAKVPLITYRQLSPKGKEILINEDLYYLLRYEPNDEMDSMNFRQTLTSWALGWGNGYGEIIKDNGNRTKSIWPIHPARVTPTRINGQLAYRVTSDRTDNNPNMASSEPRLLRPDQTLHIRGLGSGLVGYSVLQLASESLGLSLAAEKFGASFFGNGTKIGGILKHPEKLDPKVHARLKESWESVHAGPDNAHKPVILEEGMSYETGTVPPDEAQFLESRQFQIEEVARWFRIPPHKLQHLLRSTNNNIEHQSIEYVTDTLLPWFTRWDLEIKRKCVPLSQRDVFVEHSVKRLLMGDSKARGEYYKTLYNCGALSPDDIREEEGFNPIENGVGDKYMVQINMTTLDKVGTVTPKQITSSPENDN